MNKKLDYGVLNRVIIKSLGFDINGSDIIDQDTMQSLCIRDRLVKYTNGPSTLLHKGEAVFNPLEDRRQTQDLFSLFLRKESEFNDLYVSMYRDEVDAQGRSCLCVDANIGQIISEYFFNDTLKYIHIMLLLSGLDDEIDLTQYDNSLI